MKIQISNDPKIRAQQIALFNRIYGRPISNPTVPLKPPLMPGQTLGIPALIRQQTLPINSVEYIPIPRNNPISSRLKDDLLSKFKLHNQRGIR